MQGEAPPKLDRLKLNGTQVELWHRPQTRAISAFFWTHMFALCMGLGFAVVEKKPLVWVLVAFLATFSGIVAIVWLVARRAYYRLRLNFDSGTLDVLEIRGLDKPVTWEGSFDEIESILVEPESGDVVLNWKDAVTHPIAARLVGFQTELTELEQLVHAADLMPIRE